MARCHKGPPPVARAERQRLMRTTGELPVAVRAVCCRRRL